MECGEATKDELCAVIAGVELKAPELTGTRQQEAEEVLTRKVRGQEGLGRLTKNAVPE